MVYDILWGVLPGEGGPAIFRDYMVCFIFRYAHKEHESGRAQQSISTMQELIQWEVASNGPKRERVSKQTWPKSQNLHLIYIHKV